MATDPVLVGFVCFIFFRYTSGDRSWRPSDRSVELGHRSVFSSHRSVISGHRSVISEAPLHSCLTHALSSSRFRRFEVGGAWMTTSTEYPESLPQTRLQARSTSPPQWQSILLSLSLCVYIYIFIPQTSTPTTMTATTTATKTTARHGPDH